MPNCENCGRKFAEKRHLDQHNRRKNPCTKQFKCEKCNVYFTKQSLLKRHMKRVTPCVKEEIFDQKIIPEKMTHPDVK
jgi:sulfur relay (sulfurtransferase) DsrF/TusC family protein